MGIDNGSNCALRSPKERNTMSTPDPRLQIRKLPYRIHHELSRLLDIPGDKDWSALISVLPDGMYSRREVDTFQTVSRGGGSPASELLRDLGFRLTTVRQLTGYLTKLNHQEALLLLKSKEPVVIVEQPQSISVTVGSSTHLSCKAKGFPTPSYQWFKVGHGEIDTGFEMNFDLDNVSLTDAGEYYCQVMNDINSVSSNVVTIQVIPKDDAARRDGYPRMNLIAPSSNASRNDALEPMNVFPGQTFSLSCGVDESPDLSFYWLKDGREMPGQNRPKLIFNPFRPEDEGYYSCRVIGQERDMLTRLVYLRVATLNMEQRRTATGKVALIIGNQNYECKRPPNLDLVHPLDDARTLGSVLREMGFRVICLVDLDLAEMRKAIDGFCKMLKMEPGMYGMFYFGGHGYEEGGKTYLVPVDAPTNWSAQCTICADQVLSDMQHSKTELNVLILDVCRTPSGNDKIQNEAKSFDPYFIPGAQSVICYATCPQSQAFERKSDNNGIYMKHLVKHIRDDRRIEEVIQRVHGDISQETNSNVRIKTMSPTYTSSITREYRLLDPVLANLLNDPTELWFQRHRLPSSQTLEFDKDIRVKLSFDPVCSNLCYLVIHVEDTGTTTECDVKLFEISKELRVEDQHMNIRCHAVANFVARSNPNVEQYRGKPLDYEKRTRLPNLQKITGNVPLTLEAVYKVDEKEIRENKYLIIGRSEFGITSLFEEAL